MRRLVGIIALVIGGLFCYGAFQHPLTEEEIYYQSIPPRIFLFLFVLTLGWFLLSFLVKVTMILDRKVPTLNTLAVCLALAMVVASLLFIKETELSRGEPLVVNVLGALVVAGWPLTDLFDLFWQREVVEEDLAIKT